MTPRILWSRSWAPAWSRAALEATLRLARAREATLMPAYLAIVPHHLSLEAAVPVREAEAAVPLLELIEQRATAAGVAVDARIERGRSPRHALDGAAASTSATTRWCCPRERARTMASRPRRWPGS